MMNYLGFGHNEMIMRFWKAIARHSLIASTAFVFAACATTQPTSPPVIEEPVVEDVQKEVEKEIKEVEVKDKEDSSEKDKEAEVETVYVNNRDGVSLPHMAGRDVKRLALLLPFSSQSSRLREEAASMMKAAELSVFDQEEADVLLFSLDTGGTAQGAKSAARAAIQSGADVILGPILSGSVQAVAREARASQTPVLAFSTDQTVAGNGVYLLSFPPEAEVQRVVEYAASSGTSRFAFLGPDSEYGRRVRKIYTESVRNQGGEITGSENYKGRDISVMQAPAKRLADKHVAAERRARENGNTTPMAFEAIILPEGGTALRSLAPLLPFYDVDPADVQFLGTGLWKNEETVREPALAGGIFAGPDPEPKARFEADYDRNFGEEDERLASLAYDAVSIGAFVADGDPRTRKRRIEDPQGFYGADGYVKFDEDGKPQRSLAIFQIQNGRFVVIDPASRGTNVGPS